MMAVFVAHLYSQQISPIEKLSLAPVGEAFPHRLFHVRDDNFGIGVFSKAPLFEVKDESLTPLAIPAINVRVSFEAGEARLFGIHTLPLVSRRYVQVRNDLLAQLAQQVRDAKQPVILAGDLNTSMWTRPYQQLLEVSGMQDPRVGRGLFPAWPSVGGFAVVPIDHILVSSEIKVVSFEAVTIPGSDHRGLLARLSFKP
jgi:endonuclease/exonuclease/phosphatase (EEP) superfamily protein YafD